MLRSRKQRALANWCAVTEHLIDAVGDLLGLSPSYVRVIQDISFQPRHWIFLEFRHKVSLFLRVNHCVRFNTYCFAGVKKGLSIFACEFVHYIPARRKNAISMLSTYSNTFAAFGRLGSRNLDRRGLHARPLKQLLREPRRIEILD